MAGSLHGVGGLVFDAHRNHNELGRRDYVTGEMWKNKPPFRLAVNKATLMTLQTLHWAEAFHESGAALLDVGVPVSKMPDSAHGLL